MFWDLMTRRSWVGYVVAVLIVVFAAASRLELLQGLGMKAPYITFYPAVALSAVFGGFFPGVTATILGAALAAFFWIEPIGHIMIETPADMLSMIVFIISGILISAICEAMHRIQMRLSTSREESAAKSKLLDFAHDYIMVRDMDSRVIYWNQGAEKGYGFTSAEAEGQVTHKLLQTEFPESVDGIQAELLAGGHWEGELTHTRKDGVQIIVQSNWTLNRDAAGNPISIMEINHDITEKKKAEQQIREQSQLLDFAHDYIMVRDMDSRVVYWNQGAEKGYGFTSAEAEGQVTHKLLQTEFPESVDGIQAELLAGGHWEGELTHTRKDGVQIVVHSNWTLNRDAAGNPISIMEINHDITEKKKAEKQIHEQSQLLDLAHDCIMVRSMDGQILYWNKGAEIGYGWSASEAIGQIKHVLLTTKFPEPVDQILDSLLQEGYWDGELTHCRKDGQEIIVESHWSLSRDEAGRPVSIMEINHDITKRKKAEEMVRETNLRLQSFNDELESTVALRTRELQDINATLEEEIMERQAAQTALQKLNLDLENIVGQRTRELQDINATLEEEVMERQVAQDKLVKLNDSLETKVFERTGELQDINATLEEEIMERQAAQEALLESRDVLLTSEKQLRQFSEELLETNKELSAFSNSIAHDFRSPMVNLKGFSSELGASLSEIRQVLGDESVQLPEQVKEKIGELLDKDVPDSLHFIYSAVDRLDRMVNALLGLARMGKNEVILQDVDMNVLARQVIQSCRHQIETNNIQLTVGALPTVRANSLVMEQIVGNLVDNAVKYLMPNRPGQIAVTYTDAGDRYEFKVEDNGRGVAEDDCEKIFQVFRRAGKQDVPGDGMGLAYVRRLVRQFGGRVWCESELGVGTKMMFTVPKQS